jgi:regulatory protein
MASRPELSLKGRALQYLAAREHSRAELARKLARHAADPAEVDSLLDDLQNRGFLSEARYVASVVHRRGERFGVARIRQELLSKGTPAAEMAEALSTLRGTELQRAREVWRRRFGTAPADARETARQSRFLMARGFGSDVVRQVLKLAGADDDDAA